MFQQGDRVRRANGRSPVTGTIKSIDTQGLAQGREYVYVIWDTLMDGRTRTRGGTMNRWLPADSLVKTSA